MESNHPSDWDTEMDQLMGIQQDSQELDIGEGAQSAAESAPAVAAAPVDPEDFPRDWDAGLKQYWGATPQELRKAINDRLKQFEDTQGSYKPALDYASDVYNAVKPYEQLFAQSGLSHHQVIGNMMEHHRVLATGSAEEKFVRAVSLIQQYGIPLEHFANQEAVRMAAQIAPAMVSANRPPQQDPQELVAAAVEAQFAQRDLRGQYEQFIANDKPEHIANAEVRELMFQFMQSGKAKDFKSAYDQAVWALPNTRDSLLSVVKSEAVKDRQTVVTNAKKAAGTQPKVSGRAPPPVKESLDDFILRNAQTLGLA